MRAFSGSPKAEILGFAAKAQAGNDRRIFELERLLGQIDVIENALKIVEVESAGEVLTEPFIRRIMSPPGVDMALRTQGGV